MPDEGPTSPPAFRAALKSRVLPSDTLIERLAFGSCFKTQRNDDRALTALAAWQPQVFVFAGDTLYPDSDDTEASLPRLRQAYAALASNAPFAKLRRSVEVLPVWDDHDYGRNDGGADFPFRSESERLFLDYWGIAGPDPRSRRAGIYFSRTIGPPRARLQLIVLDTRYFRSPLRRTDKRGAPGRERYVPDADHGKTMLGDAQWSWFEKQLQQEADLRLIVSSIQVIADGHGWEGWRQLPLERERLFQALRAADRTPLLLLSGDRHVAGFYRLDIGRDRPLLEFTSSALNNPITMAHRNNTLAEAGPYRLGEMYGESNFGGLLIDWENGSVSLELLSADGELVRREAFVFHDRG
ncbi:MAG: alkaline phosphatase D family protein [Pseudomonadota bacterium]